MAEGMMSYEELQKIGRVECDLFLSNVSALQKEKRISEIFNNAGIPSEFASATLENYKPDMHLHNLNREKCINYAKNFKSNRHISQSITMFGKVGNGKTHLACAVLMEVIKNGFSGKYTLLSDLLRSVRSSYNENREQIIIECWAKPDLLVIDEVALGIGKEEVVRAILFDVVEHRLPHGKPVILVGNHNEKSFNFKHFLGQRLLSRMKKNESLILEFQGDDYRRHSHAKNH